MPKLYGSSLQTYEALNFMVSQVGKPYIYGGEGPNGYDCTGLAYAGFKSAGVNVPRFTTATIRSMGVAVASANVQPGDCIMPTSSHAFWYIGEGKVVEAAHTGTDVRVRRWNPGSRVYAVRRIAPPAYDAIRVGDAVTGGAPMLSLSEAGSGANMMIKALEPLAVFAEALTSKWFWVRVGMFMGGVTLILIAAGQLIKSGVVKRIL